MNRCRAIAEGVGSRSREPSGTELGHACPLETSPARLARPTASLPENDSRPRSRHPTPFALLADRAACSNSARQVDYGYDPIC